MSKNRNIQIHISSGSGFKESSGQIPQILVVDDDPSFLVLAKHILLKKGLTVETVDNPEQALSLTQKNHYQLLVLDINMPGKNGLELAEILHQDFPIVLVSTDQDAEELTKLRNHYNAYVDKKFCTLHLASAVQVAIMRWQEIKNSSSAA